MPVAASVARLREPRPADAPELRIEVLSGTGHALYAAHAPQLRTDFVVLLTGWVAGVGVPSTPTE